jgi:FAD:protein FMN transferase
MQTYEFKAMNTEILLAAEGSREAVETGFSQARAFIEASEKRFTRFSEESELSRLNRSAGQWFAASAEMIEVLGEALRLHEQTLGLFDPAVLKALEQAGYDRTMDDVRRFGARPAALPFRPGRYHFSDLVIDPAEQRVWLPPEMRIDLGGIAKGWIAEQAANLLAGWANACAVDAGGDMFMVGLPEGQAAWEVALENPFNFDQEMGVLHVGPGAVATSTTTRRHWSQAGQERHHLIDPRTAQPAQTDWVSVTVAAPHAVDAEVYAKSLLIGGSAQSDLLTRNFNEIIFIAVDHQKTLWGSLHSPEVFHV